MPNGKGNIKGKAGRRRRRDDYQIKEPWSLAQQCPDDNLKRFLQDLVCWGQDVRDDILRLEARVGLPAGDPGDPPLPPE